MVYKRPKAVQKDASDSVKYENAVKPFQTQYPEKDNAITVPNTNGSTTNTAPNDSPAKAPAAANTVSTAPVQTQAPKQNTGFSYADYTPSDAVTQAQALLQQQMANKPGAYQSAWQGQLSDKISQILNREDFSYDLNADALYQQYADQYIQQGKMAMMDTMGQAQAMTGGYGNSYAQSVGQQAYQAHLQQLNDIVPELYGMALDQYNQEGQELYNQAALMAQQEEQEYGRYRDQLSDYYAELDRLKDDARYQEETDYGRWADDRNFSYENFINDRNYQYQQEQDALAESWRQKEFAESQRQHNEQMALTRDKWNWEQEQAAKAGGNDGNDGENGFTQAIFSRVDENGNNVFYFDGKERTYAPGVNPYTGGKNSDVQYGTFSNGYQPDNVKGRKLYETGMYDVIDGVTQPVLKTPDGKQWIWDNTRNQYLEYDDGRQSLTSADNGWRRNDRTQTRAMF